MMELSVLAFEAGKIALHVIDKVSDGALGKAGSDVLDFLSKKLQGKLKIEKSQPKLLEAAILSEAKQDKDFREELERLVAHYQQIQNISNVSQSTTSGVNVNLGSNSGTFVGQQITNNFR
jgi:hypothetical protein